MELVAAKKSHNIRLNTRARADLHLGKQVIDRANKGVSMNLLTFRKADVVYVCDTVEYGFGGFSPQGRAWSYIIPKQLRNRAHINILEYLAQIVVIRIDILKRRTSTQDYILAIM